MSLIGFQKLFAHMVADPELCRRIKNNPDVLADKEYDLNDKEKARILHLVRQKGMGTNCMLYQINRFTPLMEHMPYTCRVLNPTIRQYTRAFWDSHLKTNFQFRDEVLLFARFILGQIQRGNITIPYLEDIVNFEMACNHIRFNVFDAPSDRDVTAVYTPCLAKDTRMVYLKHDLRVLMDQLMDNPPGAELPSIPRLDTYYLIKLQPAGIEMEPIDEDMVLAIKANGAGKPVFFHRYASFMESTVS